VVKLCCGIVVGGGRAKVIGGNGVSVIGGAGVIKLCWVIACRVGGAKGNGGCCVGAGVIRLAVVLGNVSMLFLFRMHSQ
jgi:hypothetical protein